MFKYSARVYFSDTDAGGIVYHTHYLDWAEHARTEMLRSLLPDLKQSNLKDSGLIFVVKAISIEYFKPAVLDDVIDVYTEVEKLENFSGVIHQEIKRGDELLSDIHVKVAFISSVTKRPQKLPEEVRNVLI